MQFTRPTASENVFHEGEIALQRSVGVAERMAVSGGKIVRTFMPDQHREFYEGLPFIIAASVDGDADVWATLLAGRPGFIRSPSPTRLKIDAMPYPGDPAQAGLSGGNAIGLLGIELHTRRRNRLNGLIEQVANGSIEVRAGHAFGNCPQYIQLRDFVFERDPSQPPASEVVQMHRLDTRARAMIEGADTFFVASYAEPGDERQVDVSHRGGKSGFVRVDETGTLTIPDFAGNLHFNTLGNFLVNPRAGLLFVDFSTGDVLQLTGVAEVFTESPEIDAFRGAERLWTFRPTKIFLRHGASPIRWGMGEDAFSPNSLMTGSWEDAAARIAAENLSAAWRPMKIFRIVEETEEIRSFYLEPADGKGLANFKAGQHLPVRAILKEGDAATSRVYTLSSAPSDGFYRISVKRQGVFSNWLHSQRVGAAIEARGPDGSFYLSETEKRAAVLLAAGVGVTPMLSMLRHIVFEGKRTRKTRPTWLIQAARSLAQRPFPQEIGALVAQAEGAVRFVPVHSAHAPDEREDVDYSFSGRFTAGHLPRFLPFGDYDFYICGPSSFMEDSYAGLRALGVADERIHTEAFGPSALARTRPGAAAAAVQASAKSVPVLFTRSAKEARWQPESGSLLDLAEQRGLSPDFSCRIGSCGTCAVRLISGVAAYPNGVAATPNLDEVLLCSAVPATGSGRLEIDL